MKIKTQNRLPSQDEHKSIVDIGMICVHTEHTCRYRLESLVDTISGETCGSIAPVYYWKAGN